MDVENLPWAGPRPYFAKNDAPLPAGHRTSEVGSDTTGIAVSTATLTHSQGCMSLPNTRRVPSLRSRAWLSCSDTTNAGSRCCQHHRQFLLRYDRRQWHACHSLQQHMYDCREPNMTHASRAMMVCCSTHRLSWPVAACMSPDETVSGGMAKLFPLTMNVSVQRAV